MLLPMLKVNQAFHIVVEIIGKGSHEQEEENNSYYVTYDLNRSLKSKEPIRPQKDEENKNAKCFKKKKGIP
jgi:hypothetical protein